MRQAVRLKLSGLVLGMLGIIMAIFMWPSAGAAQTTPGVSMWDPQTTNVPYLAWAGEQLRLEKCFPMGSGVTADSASTSGLQANFTVEDWSGTSSNPNLGPQIDPATVSVFPAGNEVCARGDALSLYPGMARIELDVVGQTSQIGYDPSNPVLHHQFLAGWMTLNQPTLTEMSSTSFASTAQTAAASALGDPTGNGQFNAGGNNGYLDVHVTGSMPMTGAWQGLVGASSVTLPNDWITLAHALATDANPSDTAPWNTWDTSGDSTPIGYEGHIAGTPCPASGFTTAPILPTGPNSYTSPIDNGDNCTAGGSDGPFSTVFGLSGSSAIGPFDPLDPTDTLLSNGDLSTQDAPMPAARIDVSIAPNSGAATDTSGVGSLVAADKNQTYSRDFTGASTAHNLYAPFYDAYIPATMRGDISSGIDGAKANNFAGFLSNIGSDGVYHFWDTYSLISNTPAETGCLQFSNDHNPQGGTADPANMYYNTPSGDSSVAVYTDQNGEAQVQYDPGTGFYFNSLINNGSAIVNANGGCDLQSLFGVPGGLGTSSITAKAQYPYKPVDFPAMTSAPVKKSVASLWSKTLAYYAKGAGTANNNARIVVAHAQDINGAPFSNEVVCWFSNGEGMFQWSGTVNGTTIGGKPFTMPSGSGFGNVCGKTDSNGNAAVEVFNSNPTSVNVIADFIDEGILRSVSVNFGTPGGGGTPPPTPGGGSTAPGGSTSGATTPPISLVAKLAPQLTKKVTIKTSTKARVTLARLYTPARGAHYALVRVTSSAKTVRLRLRMRVKTAKGTKVITRVVTIKANRTVKLGMSKSVVKVLGVTAL